MLISRYVRACAAVAGFVLSALLFSTVSYGQTTTAIGALPGSLQIYAAASPDNCGSINSVYSCYSDALLVYGGVGSYASGLETGSLAGFGNGPALFCNTSSGWSWCNGLEQSYFLDLEFTNAAYIPPAILPLSYLVANNYTQLTQTASGAITLTYSGDGYSIALNLAEFVDPIQLSSLVPPAPDTSDVDGINYLNVEVTGGLETTCAATGQCPTSPVPLPASIWLLLGGLGLLGRKRTQIIRPSG
jgi:hypothetical protein